MIKKIIVITIVSFNLALANLSCSGKKFQAFYFIPKGYTGFVNIIYNDASSKNKVMCGGNTFIYFITGNPTRFSVSSKLPESGIYTDSYFYYDKDSVSELPNLTSSKSELSQIFYQASATKPKTKTSQSSSDMVRIHQFYVADRPYREQEFYSKFPDLENLCCY